MITYLQFINRWPAYASIPYTQDMVEMRLMEIDDLFPQIVGCLPEKTWPLAYGYAFKDLELQEDCDSIVGLVSVTSLNDKQVFKTGKTPFALNTTLWGSRLTKMFKAHGCHIGIGKTGYGCGEEKGCGC